MIIRVESHLSYKYREVYRIIEFRGNSIYKTKFIGYIKTEDQDMFDKDKHIFASLSTKLTQQKNLEIDLLI